jgi:SAM-dependent methyltransferase
LKTPMVPPVRQSVERFSSRVENYIKYRPGYPAEIIDLLKTECGLTPASVVADIGSGTGKLTELFLANGNVVFAVEPNVTMRAAAEEVFKDDPGFRSIDGHAESTTLPSSTIDLITAGQAFHWFDLTKTRIEWTRILKRGGWAVIVWNERKLQATPFLRHYEELLVKFGTDYQEIRHDHKHGTVGQFFAPDPFVSRTFPNAQLFDFDGLRGRVLSSSYTPEPDHPHFEPMLRQLKAIFDKHQDNGYVHFEYDTKVFYGHLSIL